MDEIKSIPEATKIQFAGEGKVYDVVRPDELFNVTKNGWTVVGDYREHAAITYKPPARDPTPTEKAAGAYGLVYDPQVHAFGEKQMFVVCRDAVKLAEEKAHAEEIAELRGALADQQRINREQTMLHGSLAKKLEELQAKYDREATMHNETINRKRSLETDIGKIREAVGALQFKDILGR